MTVLFPPVLAPDAPRTLLETIGVIVDEIADGVSPPDGLTEAQRERWGEGRAAAIAAISMRCTELLAAYPPNGKVIVL